MTLEAVIRETVAAAVQDALAAREKRCYTADKAAEYIGCSESQLRNLAAAGKIKVVRYDSRDRYDIQDLDDFVRRSKG